MTEQAAPVPCSPERPPAPSQRSWPTGQGPTGQSLAAPRTLWRAGPPQRPQGGCGAQLCAHQATSTGCEHADGSAQPLKGLELRQAMQAVIHVHMIKPL